MTEKAYRPIEEVRSVTVEELDAMASGTVLAARIGPLRLTVQRTTGSRWRLRSRGAIRSEDLARCEVARMTKVSQEPGVPADG